MVGRSIWLSHKNKALISNQGDRVLQFAAQSFDASIWEIFNTVLNGGTLVLPDNEVRQSVEALTDLIATQNVTHAFLPPALAGLIPTGSLSTLSVRLLWVERPVRLTSSPALPVVCG